MSLYVSSLPDAWVEKIWATMRGSYGAQFDRQWECPAGVKPEEHVASMKAIWGRELAAYQQNPNAIAFALDHLPEYPPNLVQFRALCARRPTYVQARIGDDSSKPDPEAVAAILAGISKPDRKDPQEWAHALRRAEESGQKLGTAQRVMWRSALQEGLA